MGIFKEEAIQLEAYANQQKRIWGDSADHGIMATASVKKNMRSVVETLLPLPDSKVIWKMDANGITQRQYRLVIYWSPDEFTVYDVLYFKDRKKEFFTIEIESGIKQERVC